MTTSLPPTPEHIESTDDANDISPKPALPSGGFNILLDDEGLRPIWGLAIFLLLWELLRDFVYPLLSAIFPSPSHHELISVRRMDVFEIGALICVGVPTLMMAKLEGHSIGAYGFMKRNALQNFLIGAATGAILLSALVGVLRAAGLLVFDGRQLFGGAILRAGITWAFGFLLVALAEEMLLRGYLQFTLTRTFSQVFRIIASPRQAERAAFWSAAVILSIAFGYGHVSNSGESPLGLINAALVGLVFCLSLWRTGSLWWAIGFHAAWDWAQSFFYGVADSGLMVEGHLLAAHPAGRPILSGGLTGPEGSLFLLPIILVACAAIFLTLRPTPMSDTTAVTPVSALDLP